MMCGRVTLTLTLNEVAEILNISHALPNPWTPRYNLAPTQDIPVLVQEHEKTQLKLFHWGLIPFWAKDKRIGQKLINARAETIDIKPSFRHAFKRQRCIILADGFYEWKREGKTKTPYRFTLKDRKLLGFAGIWDMWKSPEDKVIHSCSIITTTPNKLMETIHDRMPVILERDREQVWLDPAQSNCNLLKSVLVPYPTERMDAYEVSPRVNSARYESPDCIVPVTSQVSLFN